ncbi:GNAT family N-acetyltransferase [Alkalinema pantanalense CENA528]|uniref:GNAT family N-acetyltransferase n=1 Tax=Alkalinema pantanalense TaxID=1620705 RepID=UPI003D6E237F
MRDSALPQEFVIRPANRRDTRSITQLTRALASFAFQSPTPASPSSAQALAKSITHPILTLALPETGWGYFRLGMAIAIAIYALYTIPEPTGVIFAWLILLVSLGLLTLVIMPWVNWSDYWVVEHRGSVVACAKLYLNPTHSEVYDVFVHPYWRGKGLGAALIQTLIQEATIPIYLASLPTTISFYQKLGFAPIEPRYLEPNLRNRLSLNNPKFRHKRLTAMVLTSRG